MHHITDVAFVDTHSERDGRHDAVQMAAHELLLNRLALIVGQPGMVSTGG